MANKEDYNIQMAICFKAGIIGTLAVKMLHQVDASLQIPAVGFAVFMVSCRSMQTVLATSKFDHHISQTL
jgi:hypothetical protein